MGDEEECRVLTWLVTDEKEFLVAYPAWYIYMKVHSCINES